MFILKNAIKNIFRNKGRSILLSILLIFLFTGVSVSMIIGSSAQNISQEYKEKISVSAVLKVDYMSLISTANSDGIINTTDLTNDDYKKFADSKYVKECITYGSVVVLAPKINPAGSTTDIGINLQGSDEIEEGNLFLKGYTDLNQLTDFIEGTRKITSGKVFSDLNECIISTELAEKNGLDVGDTISVRTVVKSERETLDLKVSGIYLDAKPTGQDNLFSFQNPKNDVIVGFDTLEQLDSANYTVESSFILSDPNKVDEFEKELKSKGLPEAYYISADTEVYNQILAPTEGISQTVSYFLVVILIVGVGVLILLSVLIIRERKYEIGVLRARGLSKWKIALQFIVENLAMSIICLVISMSVTALIAQPVADSLLAKQKETTQQQNDQQDNFQSVFNIDYEETSFGNDASNISETSQVKVSFGLDEIMKIILMTLLISILSSLVSVIYISKNEPMKILTERS